MIDESIYEVNIDADVVDNDIDNIDLYAEKMIEEEENPQFEDLDLDF